MSIDNVPPAFPTPGRSEMRPVTGHGLGNAVIEHKIPSKEGIDLRDYFAAKVIGGMVSDPAVKLGEEQLPRLARSAYRMADAMLAARNEPLE